MEQDDGGHDDRGDEGHDDGGTGNLERSKRKRKEEACTLSEMAPGGWVPHLKGVITDTSRKQSCTGTFTNMGYYNGTNEINGVKVIIERFENIRIHQQIRRC